MVEEKGKQTVGCSVGRKAADWAEQTATMTVERKAANWGN